MTILKIPSFILLVVTGCGPLTVSGQVSTAWYRSPPTPPAFMVMSSDQLSLTNRQINGLIEQKLIERGYSKVNSLEDANVAVVYEFAVGTGTTNISSIPNYATGGQLTQSTTNYPRSFKVMIIDLKRSQLPQKIELIWQGEIHSSGTTSNFSTLAPDYVEIMFDNYGETVSNKNFRKILSR